MGVILQKDTLLAYFGVKVAARLWFNATVAAGGGVMGLDGNVYGHDGVRNLPSLHLASSWIIRGIFLTTGNWGHPISRFPGQG
jgi:hypothetical protein